MGDLISLNQIADWHPHVGLSVSLTLEKQLFTLPYMMEVLTKMQINHTSRSNPPTYLEEMEPQKSRLLLEARLLKGQQQYEEAAGKFIEVAEIERKWAEWAEKEGLTELAIIHRYSELSCWAQGGNPYHALRLIDDLLASDVISTELRTDLEQYQASLHYQFINWMGEWSAVAVPAN